MYYDVFKERMEDEGKSPNGDAASRKEARASTEAAEPTRMKILTPGGG
jgi:hypothetical protein